MVGKTVFSTIQEIIEPSHAALVVWDLQNPVVDYIFNKDEFMKKLTLLIEAARKLNTNIIFSYRNTSTKYESLARLYTFAKLLDSQQRSMLPPEKGIPSITINGSENKTLTTKLTTSIFIGTDYKRMIRNAESTTIIFTDITTNWHETSTRDVLNEDFLSNYNLRCGITIR